jgi:hypothetical protein
VKAEVNREMELEELRKLQTQMQDAARDIQQTVSTAGADVQTAVQDVEKSLNETIAPVTETAASATSNIPLTELTPLSEPPGTPVSVVEALPAGSPGDAAPPPDGLAEAAPASPAPDSPELAVPAPAVPAPTVPTPAVPTAASAAPVPAPAQTSLFPEHTVR